MAEEIVEEGSQEAEKNDELNSVLEGLNEDSKDEDSKDDEEKEEKEDNEDEKAKEETDEKEAGEETGEEEVGVVKQLREELKDLRQMVRTSKRELTITQAKLERYGEKSTKAKAEDKDDFDDEGEGKEKKEEKESLSTIEELQKSISNVGATKGAALDVLLEAMEQNTKYENIREVCSRENFDDIFEVIATEATKEGGNFDETLLEVELNVWNKSNPYKYMYDLIKKYHPSYAAKEGAAEPGDKKEGKVPKKKKAPGTIADKGGDSNIKGGWTAKRIDGLPEDELHTVPRDIYDKYMKDELD